MLSIPVTVWPRSGRARTVWLALLLTAVATACDCSSPGGKTPSGVTFLQLSDPHLFDAGKPRPGQPSFDLVDIRRTVEAFDWATDWPRDRRDLDFVVITGDFGLEELPDHTVEVWVRYVAARLARLPVTTILVVPGNNDLKDEDPADIQRYRTFLDALQRHLRGTAVVDLVQRSFELKGTRIVGLDSASFKNKRCPSASSASSIGCAGRFDYQRREMERLADELAKGSGQPTILFTHIPDLKDANDHSKWEATQPRGPEPKSSWDLPTGARQIWDQTIASHPSLKAVFTGHFHSAKRTDYGEPAHLLPPAVSGMTRHPPRPRTIVAPPLASKFQLKTAATARGVLIGRIDTHGGVAFDVVWLN